MVMAKRKKVEGRNLYRATVDLPSSGKRRRRTLYAKTVTELTEKVRQLKNQIETGMVTEPSRQTFGEFLDYWLENEEKNRINSKDRKRKIKAATYMSYCGIVRNHIKPAVGRVPLIKITGLHVSRVLSKMEGAELSGSTQSHAYIIMNSALRFARRRKLIVANPCEDVQAPSPDHVEMHYFSFDESVAFLQASRDDRLHAMYVLAIMRGIRQGELYALEWSDIDFGHAVVSIHKTVTTGLDGKLTEGTPKTRNSTRTIALPERCLDALNDHRQAMMIENKAGVARVFCDTQGGVLRRQNVQRRSWDKIIEAAEVSRIRFHDLRHTFVYLSRLAGEDWLEISRVLGHATVAFTMDTYGHLDDAMKKDSAKKINTLLDAV